MQGQCFVLHASSPCRAGQGNPGHLVVFLQQVCGFGGAIANLQMCLPLLFWSANKVQRLA